MNRTRSAKRLLPGLFVCAGIALSISFYTQYQRTDLRRHLDQAEVYLQEHKGSEAEAEWKAALRLDPQNADIHELLGQYAMLNGMWLEGVAEFKWLQQHAPTKKHVLCRQAACALRSDDFALKQAAHPLAEAELQRDPDCVTALGLLTAATSQEPFYQHKTQIARLRRLVKQLPDDIAVLRMFAKELLELYDYDELDKVVAHILALAPNDVDAYNLRGFANLGRADVTSLNRSVAAFETSLRIEPINGGARFGLGQAYLRQGKAKESILQFKEALRLQPGATRTYFELARAYRLARLKKEADDADTHFRIGQRREDAERELFARTLTHPNNADYARRFGLLLAESGETVKALFYLQHAAQLQPGDKVVQEAIQNLTTRLHAQMPARTAADVPPTGSTPPSGPVTSISLQGPDHP